MNGAGLDSRRWIILAASCFINLCIGSLYAWSVFAGPMANRIASIGGAPVNLAVVFTVANGVGPITMILGGTLTGKIGPRRLIAAGGALFGLGMFLSGFATSAETLIVTYGLGVGLGVGTVYGATVSNTVKFFPDRRGLAGGLTTASYGLSSVIVPVLANTLISSFGIESSFKILGAGMFVIIGTASLVIESCPVGYAPSGWNPPKREENRPADKTWREMVGDPLFYTMIAMLCCGAFSGLMVTSQAAAIAQDMIGMNASMAALVVSVLALCNTVGRIASGTLSDRIGQITTIRIVFVLCAAAMAILYLSAAGSRALFLAGICLAGFCFGSIMGIYPGFTAAQFGARHSSVNYGIMFIGFAAAGLLGPTIMSAIRADAGSYQPAFLIAMGLAAIGLALTFLFTWQQKTHRAALGAG